MVTDSGGPVILDVAAHEHFPPSPPDYTWEKHRILHLSHNLLFLKRSLASTLKIWAFYVCFYPEVGFIIVILYSDVGFTLRGDMILIFWGLSL